MIKSSELSALQKTADALAQNRAIHARLTAKESLAVIVGEDGASARVVLSQEFEQHIRKILIAAFAKRIAQNEADLRDGGVEP